MKYKKNKEPSKWKIYYQSWIPFDDETNEYFEEQKKIHISKELNKLNKKHATQHKSWREYLAK